jgi:hypothetical protein
MRLTRRLRPLALVVVLLVGISCGGSGGNADDSAGETPPDELIVQAANYELIAGEDSRFIAGLLTPEQLFVSFGTVDIEFFYLGTREGSGEAQPGPTATGEFLPIDGTEDADTAAPQAVSGSQGRGVYTAQVTFDEAGFWAAQVTADLEDQSLSGRAVFEVVEDNVYPAVGERAPRTENLTATSKDAPREAIDSRARDGEAIPDAELHEMTVAESIRRGEPALVVITTPVYCVSRFCGPITDMVQALHGRYSDRANFIHIEVWRNFEKSVINKGAADWIYRNDNLTEPWIFLIDAEGRIAARWDNVATRAEIEPLLKKLPPLRG